jgi:GntR family transcriptional regulator, transcriptional repressor for pyruvate dehydrogenase complex
MANPVTSDDGSQYVVPEIGWTRSAGPGSRRGFKRSEIIAREIVEEIISRDLEPGDLLPPESVMLAQYHVGRASLREALRLLEAQGMITLKPGPGGGPVVGDVHAANLGRTASLYFRVAGATYRELIEAVLTMDPWLAELAALRADSVEAKRRLVAAMEATFAARGDHEAMMRVGPGFHQTIYELSGNPVLSTVTCSIDAIFNEQLLRVLDLRPYQDAFLRDHEGITEAIVTSDPARSKRLAFEHMERVADCCFEQAAALLDRKIEWR